jgi:hypothetical protein
MTMDERVNLINDCLKRLGQSVEVPDAQASEIVASVLTLLGTAIIALTEIADSVGKIARQTEQEFASQVEVAAEARANEKAEEKTGRKFFGKPSN